MKRILLPILATLLCLYFNSSCTSEEPIFDTDSNHGGDSNSESFNIWLYDSIFMKNYLWKVATSPNQKLSVNQYFKNLLNENDIVSEIWKDSETPVTTTSYDIGFEYAAVKYTGDPNTPTYIIVYYVKPNISYVQDISGKTNSLKRGDVIMKVGDEDVNEQNVSTILTKAIEKGTDVKLTYWTPPESKDKEVTIKPVVATVENPILETENNGIINLGSNKKVGYLLYNSFTPGVVDQNNENDHRYDIALAQKLQNFMDNQVNYLVLDLRYNPGGKSDWYSSAQVLASAMVKDRENNKPYIILKRDREDIPNINLVTLSDYTKGSTPVSIPRLGDQLKYIYIITGAYTSGASEVFINAIWPYRQDVSIIGEKTSGEGANPIAIGHTSRNGWSLNIALGYMASQAGHYDYANGITPYKTIYDVPKNLSELLEPLGNQEEAILYSISLEIQKMTMTTKSSLSQERGSVQILSSSIINKVDSKNTFINMDDLK